MSDTKKEYSADELLQFAYKHNQIPVVLFAKDRECRYIYTSEIEELIDSGKEKSILGKTDMDIQYDPNLGKQYYEQDKNIMRTGKSCHCYSEFTQNGKTVYREIAKSPVYADGKVIGVCGVVNDVTELMSLKKKFETLTFYDKLTGLYNRNYFLKFDFSQPQYLPCSYIMCDCNDLKGVNDRLGHNAGDTYICETAKLLKEIVSSDGICIRWGGDEFLLIVPSCDEDKCKKLIAGIEQKQNEKRTKFPYMEIAVGYYVRKSLLQSENETIQLADENMYADKKRRKVTVWK